MVKGGNQSTMPPTPHPQTASGVLKIIQKLPVIIRGCRSHMRMWYAHAWSLDSLQVMQSLKIMLEWITFSHDFRGSRNHAKAQPLAQFRGFGGHARTHHNLMWPLQAEKIERIPSFAIL